MRGQRLFRGGRDVNEVNRSIEGGDEAVRKEAGTYQLDNLFGFGSEIPEDLITSPLLRLCSVAVCLLFPASLKSRREVAYR